MVANCKQCRNKPIDQNIWCNAKNKFL